MDQVVYGIVGKLLTYVQSNDLVYEIDGILACIKMEEFHVELYGISLELNVCMFHKFLYFILNYRFTSIRCV